MWIFHKQFKTFFVLFLASTIEIISFPKITAFTHVIGSETVPFESNSDLIKIKFTNFSLLVSLIAPNKPFLKQDQNY